MEPIILLGCGGHAKSVVDVICRQKKYKILGFVDNEKSSFTYRNYEVIGTDDDLERIFAEGTRWAFISIGYLGKGVIREKLNLKLKKIGFKLATVIDPSAVLAEDSIISPGCFVGKHAVINSDSKIGENVIVNSGAIIEHDCSIGEFTHVAVSATICGGVRIGKRCLIGANSTIIQGKHIGDNVIIGAGCIVYKDIGKHMKLICNGKEITRNV